MVPYSKGCGKATPRFLVLNWLSTVKLKCYLFLKKQEGFIPYSRADPVGGLRGL